MEYIVHFDVEHKGTKEVSKLRGLVMVPKGERPSVSDLVAMFSAMGYDVRCEDEATYTFVPNAADTDYTEIHIKKMDNGEEEFVIDPHLKMMVDLLVNKPNRPM
ncbi:dipeptidyl aminopeptidase [Paenibacillus sp. 481]|uniref:dipeptidyl aminopeptidase n=1 Tax=Paenibacillus sp. 481 TaxID=2835869 RepID=UPI001E3AA396|nr:dipeptidyl aminopeptidase [Paenibacillus sp. 481]UHA75016.1 dipeptidyl aminopeptidase [Paenibacillus sp. 481]